MQSCRGELGTTKGTTKVAKVATSDVACVSRHVVSPFVATYPCGMSSQNGQRRRPHCRPSRSDGANTHESNEIVPAMWGVVTQIRPAPSTQTIENKRAILRHRARGPRKTEIENKRAILRHRARGPRQPPKNGNFPVSGYPLYSSGEPSYPWTRAVGGEDRGN